MCLFDYGYNPPRIQASPLVIPPNRELEQQRFERQTSTGSGRFASLGGGLVKTLG